MALKRLQGHYKVTKNCHNSVTPEQALQTLLSHKTHAANQAKANFGNPLLVHNYNLPLFQVACPGKTMQEA